MCISICFASCMNLPYIRENICICPLGDWFISLNIMVSSRDHFVKSKGFKSKVLPLNSVYGMNWLGDQRHTTNLLRPLSVTWGIWYPLCGDRRFRSCKPAIQQCPGHRETSRGKPGGAVGMSKGDSGQEERPWVQMLTVPPSAWRSAGWMRELLGTQARLAVMETRSPHVLNDSLRLMWHVHRGGGQCGTWI